MGGNPSQPPLGKVRRTVREIGLGLITAGIIVLLFVVYQLWGTGFAERHNQTVLAQQFQATSSGVTGTTLPPGASPSPSTTAAGAKPAATTSTTVAAPTPPPGGALAHLVIPKIGVDKYVVEGVTESDLQKGPGHYLGTAYPGQLGNVGIAGHRTTYGAPFYRLNELATGDPIYITTTNGSTYTYLVTGQQVVDPSDVAVLTNTPTVAELTLTTCNPRFSATSRLVVTAKLAPNIKPAAPTTATPAPATGAKPVAVGSAAADINLGSGNGAAWPPVFGYGAVFLLLWVATRLAVNRTRRWARFGAYVVGIGVCLIPLWFVFENVANLLPQNI